MNGPAYKSVYGTAVAVTYNYEEAIFYGVYDNPSATQVATLITSDQYGDPRYFFKDESIVCLKYNQVNYNANGGNGAPSSQTKVYGTVLTLSAVEPTRTGYTFMGWSTTNDSTVEYASEGQYDKDAPITLYAVWEANTYTVTYKANGGVGSDQTQEVIYGESWKSKNAVFSKTGYTQTSWNTKKDGTGVSYKLNANQTNAQLSDLTMYAIYTENTYYVKYNANGGYGNMDESTHKYGTASVLSENKYLREGYSFKKWNTKSDGSGTSYENKASVLSLTAENGGTFNLYAIWDVNLYSLIVNPNGGIWNGSTEEQSLTKEYGSTLSLENPTRVGYRFLRWSLSGYGSIENNVYTFDAGNGTLTAQWERIVLEVSFDASTNGGSPDSKKDVYYGDTVGSLPVPKKPYYKFFGWFTKPVGGVKIGESQIITDNVIYYAQFKIEASAKVIYELKKYPAIIWIKQNDIWVRCLAWCKYDETWYKSTGA